MLSGLSPEVFIDLHRAVVGAGMLWPDLTILLDIPVEVVMHRRHAIGRSAEFFEKRELLERVRHNYLTLANHSFFRDQIVVINGDQSPELVFEDIRKIIEPRLPSRG